MVHNNPTPFWLLVGAVTAGLLIGCAAVRSVTYPPDFQYITQKDLRSSMHRMARQVVGLEKALAKTARTAGDTQTEDQIVGWLTQMDTTASEIKRDGAPSNHPLLDRNLDTLLSRIRSARAAAMESPPRLLPAVQVSGACSGCHMGRAH